MGVRARRVSGMVDDAIVMEVKLARSRARNPLRPGPQRTADTSRWQAKEAKTILHNKNSLSGKVQNKCLLLTC